MTGTDFEKASSGACSPRAARVGCRLNFETFFFRPSGGADAGAHLNWRASRRRFRPQAAKAAVRSSKATARGMTDAIKRSVVFGLRRRRTSTTAGPTRRAARGRRFRVNRFQRFREEGFYLLPFGRQVKRRGHNVSHCDTCVGPHRLKSLRRSDASRNTSTQHSVPPEASAGAAALSCKHRQHARTARLPGQFAPGGLPCLKRAASCAGLSNRAVSYKPRLPAAEHAGHGRARTANHQETVLLTCRKS